MGKNDKTRLPPKGNRDKEWRERERGEEKERT